jgi:hypothetical protein
MTLKSEDVLRLRPVPKGEGCEYCNYTGKLLYFHAGGSSIPGNAVKTCPKCKVAKTCPKCGPKESEEHR